LPRPINDRELLFHKKAVGYNSFGPAWSKQFGECDQQMCKQ